MDRKYAGFGIRLIAHMVDVSILLFPISLAAFVLGIVVTSVSGAVSMVIILITILLLDKIVRWIYFSWFSSSYGATLGKMICGIKVEMLDGSKMDFTKSLFRHTLGYLTSAALFGIGYLAIIKDEMKRGWHDKVSDTVVVYRNRGNIPAGLFTFVMLMVLNGYLSYTGVHSALTSPLVRMDLMRIEENIKMAPVPLVGTRWRLTHYADNTGKLMEVEPGNIVTANFDGQTVSGSAGCNSYRANYQSSADSILFLSPAATTRVYCENVQIEGTYLNLLSRVAKYKIEGGLLKLLDSSGSVALGYIIDGPKSSAPAVKGSHINWFDAFRRRGSFP